MYSRSWTTSENLCNRNTFFFHTSWPIMCSVPRTWMPRRREKRRQQEGGERTGGGIFRDPLATTYGEHSWKNNLGKTRLARHAWKISLEDSMVTTFLKTLLEKLLWDTIGRHSCKTLFEDTLGRHSPFKDTKRHNKNASATKSPAQHNAITNATESTAQQNHLLKHSRQRKQHHQRNKITSATKSPAQQHHQRNEITSPNKSLAQTKSPAQTKSAEKKSRAQQNHQRNEITSTTTSPAQRKHQRNESTSATTTSAAQWNHNEITSGTKSPAQQNHQRNILNSTHLHTSPHSTLHTPPHSTLYTLHTPHSHTPHSTIHYCRKVFCVTAYPCVSTSVPLTYVWAFGFVGCILVSNRLECHKVPRLPRKTTWQPAWKPSKRRGFAASPIDTAMPQENQRLETRHVGAAKRACRARLAPILTLSTRYQTGWNVTKCNACHAKRHDNLLGNLRKGEVLQLHP